MAEIKLYKYIKEQIDIVAKDNRPSVSTRLGGDKPNPIQQIREEITEMIKHKADANDVLKIQETKTNKVDSVNHMECLEVMQRML